MLRGHDRYCSKVDSNKIDKIDLYYAIKDASWPLINGEQDIALLSSHIRQEFDLAYSQIKDQMLDTRIDICGILKQEYARRIDSACAQIQWHKDYYESYPLDLDFCDTMIDINDDNEFSQYMKQELSLYCSEIFDRCWTMTHGG